MTNLQEIPTDDLLSFHDYPAVPVHNTVGNSTISVPVSQIDVSGNLKSTPQNTADNNTPHQTISDNLAGMDPPENQGRHCTTCLINHTVLHVIF